MAKATRPDMISIDGTFIDRIVPPHLQLVPQLNEVYELELAFLEALSLSDDEIERKGAYFASVNGIPTRHYQMCAGESLRLPAHSSSRLHSFFRQHQFKTGYATHGLFPYRGKFHPQMIKALLNVMGMRPGETVLDPMMGSGTVLIEASLMGIDSKGFDASPFCRFMTQTKLDALSVPLDPVREVLADPGPVFEGLAQLADSHGPSERSGPSGESDQFTDSSARDFLLLAYLDTVGYTERSKRKTPLEQFRAIVERYLFVAEKIQRHLASVDERPAPAFADTGDSRNLPLGDESIHGIVFSPPYSFAIDYLKNDAYHLGFLGVDIEKLRGRMVGLRGKGVREKFEHYRDDMDQILTECARVLQPGRVCTIVIGTNSNQLSKALDIPSEEVPGLDEIVVGLASEHGLHLARRISRQITGMANTMRTEHILFFRREAA